MSSTLVRVAVAAALAAACAVFVGSAVYVDYAGLRVRAVKDPIAAGPDGVRVVLEPAKARDLSAPFAVIANLRNTAASAASIAIRVDDREVCAPQVAGGGALRVDCQFNGAWNPATDHAIAFSSASPSWSVDALEVSTHHGSNASVVRLFVLPNGSRRYQTPGLAACIGVWLLLTALIMVRPPPLPKSLRIVHRAVIALFVLWAAVVALAPLASSYRVIVSAGTMMGWLLVCLAPRIYRVVKRPALGAIERLAALGPVPKAIVVAGLAVACFAVVVERRVAVDYGGNHSGLLMLPRSRIDANPWLQGRDDVKRNLILLDNNGYDAQFMYAIAFDPLVLRFRGQPRDYQPFIDTPPYRYGRVGYPALTRLLALNRPERFPGVMIGLIYAGVFLTAFGVGWLARQSGASAWWGLSIALVPGYWMSFRSGLPEPVAAGALVAGYLCVRSRRWIAGALLLAVACLVRETAVFFVVCIAGWLALSQQRGAALKILVLALGPLCLWRLYVGWVFAPGWGLEAYWNPPDDFGAPFAGLSALWSELRSGRYYPDLWEMRRGIVCYALLVLAATALAWWMVRVRPGAVTAAAAIFGAMAISFNLKNVWVGTGNAERLTSDLFLMLAVATPEFVTRSRAWRIGLIAFWSAAAAYLLFGTLDAEFTRGALMHALPWA